MPSTPGIEDVSVVGLGKLGLCLAAILASRGFNVRGVDIDESKVQAVNAGGSPIYEPGLERLIKSNSGHLAATSRFQDAIPNTDATFVVVPTPSGKNGEFSLRFVLPAMRRIGELLAEKKRYHLVVLTSTVMPGSTEEHVRPLLERTSGRKCGLDFGLCYNPEFIALGDAIKGLAQPDFILIGESDEKAGEALSSIHRRVCTNSPPIERMNFINAEIAKIAVNSYVTMKMSFANTLAEISEKLPGADADRIASALGRDKRIGPAYLKGALGYGGPCFPRDNIAFSRFATRIGAQARLARTTHQVNLRQSERVVQLVLRIAPSDKARIGILGLSYKPRTNVVEESQALMIARRLGEMGLDVIVYDPASEEVARPLLGDLVYYARAARECVRTSDLCVIATPWDEFANLEAALFRGKIVVDCWRLLERRLGETKGYFPIGRGLSSVANPRESSVNKNRSYGRKK